jgi:hypothetical protein
MLTELRRKLDDTSGRPKWSDEDLLGWMAEGQDKFCEDTGWFIDATTHTIDTVVDQLHYPMPDRVISVIDIWDGTLKLGRFHEPLKAGPFSATSSVSFSPAGDRPRSWQADMETGLIVILPTPQEVVSLQLHVWRYSAVSLDEDGAEPEIPPRFQRACIMWAAFQAYSDHDAEKGDKIKALDHEARFKSYVSDGVKARRRFHSGETVVSGNPSYVVR